jgi:hypothetical protein
MQQPTDDDDDDDEASISMEENVRDDPNPNPIVAARRKAAKRTLPWDLAAGELDLVSPQAEDIPAAARKKPRLEEPLPTTTDEAARKNASPDVSVVDYLPPPPSDNAAVYVDPMPDDTQPNDGATRAIGHWKQDEDAKLTSAVANTSKKRCGKEHKTDWDAVAVLVPSRTKKQCWNRWKDGLSLSIGRGNGRSGKWTEDEASVLKNAVQMLGGKNWGAIAALVPGRTKIQCRKRWNDALDPDIGLVSGRKGSWTADEISKLKDAVQRHGRKDWVAIATLVPGRTKRQCRDRWLDLLDPSSDQVTRRTGKWTENEDSKLKDAVKRYDGKNWGAIAALVPGRAIGQCRHRWHNVLDPSNGQVTRRTGKWTENEDSKLKDAVKTYDGKNWDTGAALVPGRTQKQCRNRLQVLRRSPEQE